MASGKAAGILTSEPALAQHYLQRGATFVAVGVDVLVFANAARQLRARFGADPAPAAGNAASAAY